MIRKQNEPNTDNLLVTTQSNFFSEDGAATYGSDDMSNLDNYESLLMYLQVDKNHWVLVYIKKSSSTLYYIDSDEDHKRTEIRKGYEILRIFKKIIKDKENNQTWINTNFQVKVISHSKQTDDNNCGVYAMKVS